MRWLASAGLFALVGCNQIFGLSATQAIDAPPEDRTFVTLDWQVATTAYGVDPQNSNLMTLSPVAPTSVPITPAPQVRIAPLFASPATTTDPNPALGTFIDPVGGYSAKDGTIPIPRDYLMVPWRLEYTLADGVPHEVQWKPEDKMGRITVPIFGRIVRTPPPDNSGYSIAPISAPATFTAPTVFTTGTWTEGAGTPNSAAPVDYKFANSQSLSGAIGTPDANAGDRGVFIDYMSGPDCKISVGGTDFDPTLSDPSTRTPSWETTNVSVAIPPIDTRAFNAIQDLVTQLESASSFSVLAVLPSLEMPGLAGSNSFFQLPVPVMITLLRCPALTASGSLMPVRPEILAGLPLVLHSQLVGTRAVTFPAPINKTVTLTSGIETVVQLTANTGAPPFPAPFPTAISLKPPNGTAIDLGSGGADQTPVPSSTGVFTLEFTPQAGQSADYFDVTLHKITSSGFTVERIYTVIAMAGAAVSVRIDGTVLTAGTDYVFEIRAYHGHPQAVNGDLSIVGYPYGETVTFVRTFKMQ